MICIGGPLDGFNVEAVYPIVRFHVPLPVSNTYGVTGMDLNQILKACYRRQTIRWKVMGFSMEGEAFVWEHNRDTHLQVFMKIMASLCGAKE